jgi:hypothetical protein
MIKTSEVLGTSEVPVFRGCMINLEGERATLRAMIRLYCRQLHHTKKLCEDCSELWEYAEERLEKCPYGVENPPARTAPYTVTNPINVRRSERSCAMQAPG